ncbi:hypothetical protein FJZ40_03060 [Candidatus Shapirobacteria bacterium]|nr:hypothetical protein [Candidatus Shapirobacteria bacterium]
MVLLKSDFLLRRPARYAVPYELLRAVEKRHQELTDHADGKGGVKMTYEEELVSALGHYGGGTYPGEWDLILKKQ